MTFVDTNYFLRFLLADHIQQFETAKALFLSGAQDKVQLISSTVVFFEVYWVLSSLYQLEKVPLIQTLQSVLNLTYIELPERGILQTTMGIWQTSSLDLEDAYNLAFAQEHQISQFGSFDQKLLKYFNSHPHSPHSHQ